MATPEQTIKATQDTMILQARKIERLRAALLGISTMDAYTAPDDPKPAHEVMREIATQALAE